MNRTFRLLADEQRRFVLYYLQDREDAVSVTDLAEQVTAWKHGASADAVTDERRERTELRLRNVDLPKLADAGAVEYDPRSGMVRFREPGRLLRVFLLLAARIERPLNDR